MAPPSAPAAPSLVPIHIDRTVGAAQVHIQLQAQVPAGPMRPARLLPLVRTVCDDLINATIDHVVKGGDEVSCRAGCSACCYYLVPISRAEARRLHDLIKAQPQPLREHLHGRFAAARQGLAEAGLLDALQPRADATPEERANLGRAYFALRVPCPFLDEDRGLCSIYKERPLVCREFLVVTPMERCSDPAGAELGVVKLPARASVAAGDLEPGPPFLADGWVPLSLALSWAEEHPEPPPSETGPALTERFFTALSDSA